MRTITKQYLLKAMLKGQVFHKTSLKVSTRTGFLQDLTQI